MCWCYTPSHYCDLFYKSSDLMLSKNADIHSTLVHAYYNTLPCTVYNVLVWHQVSPAFNELWLLGDPQQCQKQKQAHDPEFWPSTHKERPVRKCC